MTRSHRNEDRGGEHRWAFNGVEYPTRKLMCAARREEYVRLLDEEGMNFTQAAHAVGVSKRTGKAWRNGRTRATRRNEKPLVDRYRSTMDKPKTLHPRHLSQEERIQIADRLRLGDSIRAIARLLGRDPGTVSREVERNRNPESGGYEPYRAQQKAADRLKRPKPRKAAEGTRLWDEIAAGLRRHWSPEQISGRPKAMFPDNGDVHASVETIYQAIYLQARGGLRQELKRAMRQGRTARRPRPQTPFPRTHGHDLGATPGDRGPGGPGPLGGRPHHRQPQQKRDRHARRAHHQVHDPAAPARRARRRTRPAGHHRQNGLAVRTPAQFADLGPGSGTRPAQTDRREPGHAGTYPNTRRTTSTRSPRNSTTGHARPSAS